MPLAIYPAVVLFAVLANPAKFQRRLSISREIPMLIELGWQSFHFPEKNIASFVTEEL